MCRQPQPFHPRHGIATVDFGQAMAFKQAASLLVRWPPFRPRPALLQVWQTTCRHTTSVYNGVSWSRSIQKFRSTLVLNRHSMHIGFFQCEVVAAQAYDERLRALACHDKARLRKSLNFPSASEASFQEKPHENRYRTLMTYGSNARKEQDSFRRLHHCFLRSYQAHKFELARVSGSSRVDAIFQPKASAQGGLCIQIKSSSSASHKPMRLYNFSRTAGYAGMLLVLVALDCDLLWVVPGHQVTQTGLGLTIGTERDRCWRVSNLGSALEMYFHQRDDFPHVSLERARMACCPKNRVEEQAHLLLSAMFSCLGLQLVKSFSELVVDSLLVFPGQSRQPLRIQEKASNFQTAKGVYAANLWRRAGTLGPQAYGDTDFDVLVVSILHQERLAGMFAFPVSVLRQQGLVGQKPVRHLLHPPWLPGKKQETRDKYAWQLEYFVDLRGWTDRSELPAAARVRLDELVQTVLRTCSPVIGVS